MRPQDYHDLSVVEDRMWWFRGMREITRELLFSTVPDMAAERFRRTVTTVLDAGCGTGANLSWLRELFPAAECIGIDFSFLASKLTAERCAERGERHISLAQASVTALPFAEGQFDLVSCLDVLVQIPGQEGEQTAARELFRVLKPGGVVLIRAAALPWMRSGHDRAVMSQRRYTDATMRALLSKIGFELLRTTYANTLLFPVAVFTRKILKPLGLQQGGSDVRPSLPLVDDAFRAALNLEARWLRAPDRRLPVGLSLFAVARRPLSATAQ